MPEVLNAAQKELVQKNLDLAHFLARDAYRRNTDELDIEEVVSVAYQGLIRAAQKFDPSRMSPETVANGKAFAGFARQKINGAILDWQREIDHVQRTYRQWYKQLQKLGYVAYETPRSQVQEYSLQLGLEFDKLVQIIRAVENRNVSINYERPPGASSVEGVFVGTQVGWTQSAADIESDAVGQQITDAVQSAFERLPDTQKAVIILRQYAQEEFQNIAVELDLSLTAVRDAHSEALLSIHRAMVRTAKV